MELPLAKKEKDYRTLDEIRLRKDELAGSLQKDNHQFSTLWNQLFTTRKDGSTGERIATLVANSVTAIDAILLIRKLAKNYGFLLKRKKK